MLVGGTTVPRFSTFRREHARGQGQGGQKRARSHNALQRCLGCEGAQGGPCLGCSGGKYANEHCKRGDDCTAGLAGTGTSGGVGQWPWPASGSHHKRKTKKIEPVTAAPHCLPASWGQALWEDKGAGCKGPVTAQRAPKKAREDTGRECAHQLRTMVRTTLCFP